MAQTTQDKPNPRPQPPGSAPAATPKPKPKARVPAGVMGPLRLASLNDYTVFANSVAPTGPYDPAGAYELTYRISLIAVAGLVYPTGVFNIKRTPSSGGGARIEIYKSLAETLGAVQVWRVAIECANDPFHTPLSWTLSHEVHDQFDKPTNELRWSQQGTISQGKITTVSNGKTFSRAVSSPLLCSWTLFAALPLVVKGALPFNFTYLDGFDAVLEDHRLSDGGRGTITINGEEQSLRGLRHTGRGMIPEEFWFDDQGRLAIYTTDETVMFPDANAQANADEYRKTRAQISEKRAHTPPKSTPPPTTPQRTQSNE